MPEVWRIRSRIMIGRLGTSSASISGNDADLHVLQGRQKPADGRVEPELAFLTNIIAASAITGLVIEDRPEDGIAWHHGASLAIAKSIGLMEGNLAAPADHHDRAEILPCLLRNERGAEALKPCRRKAKGIWFPR